MTFTPEKLAKKIEQTLLAPEAAPNQIDRLCRDALRYGFHAVCVNPVHVRRAVERLARDRSASPAGRAVIVVSVAGFPLGASRSDTKADEARRALDDGAAEIDMVADLGALISGDRKTVRADIETVAQVVHRTPQGILKVILETGVLTMDQVILGCRCCAEGEADFVKTSTGFHSSGGATVEQVRLLHRHAAPLRVKAAGGIRTAEAAFAMIEAGADRIGTSAGVAILDELGRLSP